jgi:hypothetical protein
MGRPQGGQSASQKEALAVTRETDYLGESKSNAFKRTPVRNGGQAQAVKEETAKAIGGTRR